MNMRESVEPNVIFNRLKKYTEHVEAYETWKEERKLQVLRIDGIPPNLNKYRNMYFHQLNTEKKAWQKLVASAVISQNIKPVKRIKQTYEFYFKTQCRHDPDNYAACAKFLNDGLVHAGILVDDDFDHIESLTIKQGGFSKDPYILIKLEEVEDERTT